VPGELAGAWPFDDPAHEPFQVDLADQVRRAVLDLMGARCTVADAITRVERAAVLAGYDGGEHARAFDRAKALAAGRVESHECDVEHRTHRQMAICAYTNAYSKAKVTGKGKWAVVSFCAKPTVTLWPEQWRALKALRRLEDNGCGPRCRDRHALRVLSAVSRRGDT
jgi:hypothetical protein